MTRVNNNTNTPAVRLGDDPPVDPTTQDATAQAAMDLGYLAYLARGYSALEAELAGTTDPTKKAALQAQLNAIQAQFNQIAALYSVDASGNVSFTYTDSSGHTETIQIPSNDTNKDLLTAIKTMVGSYKDITKYLTFADANTNNPLLTVYEWLENTNYTFELCTNPATQTDAIFFMMSLAGSPIGDLSGDVDQFLDQGNNNGAILPQSLILAQTLAAILATSDPQTLAAISACLSVTTKDSDYQALEQEFQMITSDPNWKTEFSNLGQWTFFESRFWPYTAPTLASEHIFKANAVAMTGKSENDKDKRR